MICFHRKIRRIFVLEKGISHESSESEMSSRIQQPVIVKYAQQQRCDVQPHTLSRCAIGYVVKGKKYIYYGDTRREVVKGDMFFLNTGTHYSEEIPEAGKSYEQIVFYYTPEALANILSTLSLNYKLEITNDHQCDKCRGETNIIYPTWPAIRNFFSTVNQYIKENVFVENETAEHLKITELVYLIISNPKCCIKSKLLANVDFSSESFERVILDSIFSDISVEGLALKCHQSITSFKKEFKKQFNDTPHRWFIRQRLMHARLLLISTNRPISEISRECKFQNISHFIKLFKKEYDTTPAAYRSKSIEEKQLAQKSSKEMLDKAMV